MERPFTAYHNSPNKSPRLDVPRKGVVLHHAAMTSLDALRDLAMGAKEVSATAICKDRNLEQMIPEGFRAWSLSSAYWDSALRSVETCNESTNGWTISNASHAKLAQGVAYWATVDKFWPHRDGDPETWTVLGHREVYTIHDASYATACPGGMDLDLVTRLAQEILKGSAPSGEGSTPLPEEEEEDMAKNSAFIYTRVKDKKQVVLLVNTTCGWWMEYVNTASVVPKGNNPIAATLETGAFAWVSETFAVAMKNSLTRAQGQIVSGELTIADEA